MKSLKHWTSPKLTAHGSIQDITTIIKSKRLGSSDDFGVTGVTDGVLS